MTQPCPHCKKKIDTEKLTWEYHSTGRQSKCPECKKRILMTASSRTHVPGPRPGQLVRRFRKNKV